MSRNIPTKPQTDSDKRVDAHRKALYALLSKHGHDFLVKNGINARDTVNAHVKAEKLKRVVKHGTSS